MSIYEPIKIFEQEYDGESLYDLDRDISEINYDAVPVDKYNFPKGRFVMQMMWYPDEDD